MFRTSKFGLHLTTTTTLFGSCPSDPSIYEQFLQDEIDSSSEKAQAERAALPEISKEQEKTTVFLRVDGQPALFGHVIKGYLKSACGALWRVNGTLSVELRAYKKVIDQLIFPFPDIIPLNVSDAEIEHLATYLRKDFTVCVRPLRAQTAQGPRVALARSEVVPPGTELDFVLTIIGDVPPLDRQTTKKVPISEELLHEWFAYGEFHGLGSWRNAGWGKFTYEMERIEL